MREEGAPHVLVDIREDREWAAGHAAGAVHIGKGVIERDIEAKHRTRTRSWCSIAAGDFARRSPPRRWGAWVTGTSCRSMAAGAPGKPRDCPRKPDYVVIDV